MQAAATVRFRRCRFGLWRVVNRYVNTLRRRGVHVVETEVEWFERSDGRVIVYHVQPALAPETLGLDILRRSTPRVDHPLLSSVVGHRHRQYRWRCRCGRPDQQLVMDGRRALATGPLDAFHDERCGPAGSRYDPVPGRASGGRPSGGAKGNDQVDPSLANTSRFALTDLAANVIKADLEGWMEPVLECINRHVDEPIMYQEAMQIYKSDRRTFPFLLVLGRANRLWQEQVRRRPYEFLLPESTTYKAQRS